MSITEIKQAIAKLSSEELASFHEWFEEYYAELWDNQDKALIEERRKESERPLREYLKEKKN